MMTTSITSRFTYNIYICTPQNPGQALCQSDFHPAGWITGCYNEMVRPLSSAMRSVNYGPEMIEHTITNEQCKELADTQFEVTTTLQPILSGMLYKHSVYWV